MIAGCGAGDPGGDADTSASVSSTADDSTSASTMDGTGTESGTDDGPLLDVGHETDTGSPQECKVNDGMDAVGDCDAEGPPDSFDPAIQWTFEGMGDDTAALSVPAVVNLTDDDENGEIDLCDTPDVVATLYPPEEYFGIGHIYVLDGESGDLHFQVDYDIAPATHVAVGDIDDDGLAEIVSFGGGVDGRLVAFEHDGTLKWEGDTMLSYGGGHAVALADLDADGDVEIMLAGHVADHEGKEIFTDHTGIFGIQLTTAADLDDDGDMEVIIGPIAYHHDGTKYYDVVDAIAYAHPQVADLDDDGQPEILLMGGAGAHLLEHDGTQKFVSAPCGWDWMPSAIHDIDGDMAPEVAGSSHTSYCVAQADLSVAWTTMVMDDGYAGGTAFDFLGKGVAQAMYADNVSLYVFGDQGQKLLTANRSSVTQTEFPVVADVDDDGSAEIVVVSNAGYGQQTAPGVQVIRDAEDRWIQARRIWNQHTYHVTNVYEDGTIPQDEAKSWTKLNTFRTQAQITANGDVCQPMPEG
jgi:hypothetical protein